MSSKSVFEVPEESGGKFARKAKESPFMLVGMAGFVGAAIWGAYKFKHRGGMSTSVFLMQLRVIAQGAVVGTLTLGLGYAMAKEYLLEKPPKEDLSIQKSIGQ